MQAYIRQGETRFTAPAEARPLWWQEKGLSYTASGYGRKIPTRYMVQLNGRWRRVYCCIFSNVGTCYVGNLSSDAMIVSDIEEA